LNAGDWAQDCQDLFLDHFLGKINVFLKPQNENHALSKRSARLRKALSEIYDAIPYISRSAMKAKLFRRNSNKHW